MPPYRVPDEIPANDNEHPDHPWQRADLILRAYAGTELDTPEDQRTAVSQLLTDIMHYCEVMSRTHDPDHPDNLDFEDLLDQAYLAYNVQSESMNHVIDKEVGRTSALVQQRMEEMKAERTAGDASKSEPQQAPDTAAYVVFGKSVNSADRAKGASAEPANDNYKHLDTPLEETLNQLQMLEHAEHSPGGLSAQDLALKERLEKQEHDLRTGAPTDASIIPLYRELQYIQAKDAPYTEAEQKRHDIVQKILDAEPELRNTLAHLDARQQQEIADLVTKQRRQSRPDYGQQWADLEKRHDDERDRYIGDYQKAQALQAEMENQERRQTIDRSPDDDQPKLTR